MTTATDQLGPFYRLGIGSGQGPEAPALHNLCVNIHNLRERFAKPTNLGCPLWSHIPGYQTSLNPHPTP